MICLYCHGQLTKEADIFTLFQKRGTLCAECEEALSPSIQYERCTKCQKVLDVSVDECDDCKYLKYEFKYAPHKITTCLDYNDSVKMLFHRYKFVNDAALSEVVGAFINFPFEKYDFIIPIPISHKRLRERTYNQTTLVLDFLNVKYTDVLSTSKIARQSELTKLQRIKQQNPFSFKNDDIIDEFQNKNVLIVDDIYTTGITVYQATQLMYYKQVRNVDVLTFSRS